MRDIVEAFAPSGEEGALREILKQKLRGKFDEFRTDNMGNLIARSGDGRLCIECGMDSIGVMVVSKESHRVKFSPVGQMKAKEIIGRKVTFVNGVSGEICCDEEKKVDDAKLSDLYINMDETTVDIGDFGGFEMEYEEEECAYCGYGLGSRIGLAAVCKAIEQTEDIENVTVLFSSQKCLGARGLQAFFGANSFQRIVVVDGCSDDGCTIIAKDARSVSNRNLRMTLENIAEKREVLADTVVSEHNFNLEKISTSCGDPCAAIGICVDGGKGEKERVSKFDFDMAVGFLTGLLKGDA